METHYDDQYFEWQRKSGEFCGAANRLKFEAFSGPDKAILDFGCGGGFMLKNLPAKTRMGVEINPSARKLAIENGIEAVSKTEEVPNDFADLIISDHALEHTPHPLEELKKLFPKLKAGGKIVFVVPCEHVDYNYVPDDINQHLYSWSPMAIGNLFTQAGFQVISSRAFFHKHFPYSYRLRPLIGEKAFNFLCKMNGLLNRRRLNEVQVIAQRLEI
jgi:SAM-dependent methyltransferase